ncbi:hypothetical protein LguiA_033272 [Lonicera macranthoides]
MSRLAEADKVDNPEFKWGKKRGVGGKKKEVQFYESFTYDGLEYCLHDCVYMHKEGEPEPYIGKLIKIWETPDKSKKVKVHWFFRPLEILNWLGDGKALKKEIFLASGEGVGLANVNTLEAISGKCNVVCISKDNRNPQPSEEELKMADFVFYRTFDVQHCTVLDKMDDKVGGLEVKYIFNKKESEKANGVPKFNSDKEEDEKNDIAQNLTEELKTPKADGNYGNSAMNVDADVKDLPVKRDPLPGSVKDLSNTKESLLGKPATGARVRSSEVACLERVLGEKTISAKGNSNKVEVKVNNAQAIQPKVEERVKDGKDIAAFDDRPSKKAKFGDSVNLYDDKSMNSTKKLSVNGNDVKALAITANSSEGKTKSRFGKDSLGIEKGVKSAKVDTSFKVPEDRNKNGDQKFTKNLDGNFAKDFVASRDRTKSKLPMDSLGLKKAPLKEKIDEKIRKLSSGKLAKVSISESADDDKEKEGQVLEVTRRPDAEDRSNWFRALDIIWHAFKEKCTAKMVQRTAISSPHIGQAFVIFKTREAAERVVRKLDEGCLMLTNGRPLVGSIRPLLPSLDGKQSTYFGHLVIDKIKLQMQREMKDAVSTSHCSQPNTIEYEMAMEWCLLQERSDAWWKRLYKQQGEEMRKLKANLKSK